MLHLLILAKIHGYKKAPQTELVQLRMIVAIINLELVVTLIVAVRTGYNLTVAKVTPVVLPTVIWMMIKISKGMLTIDHRG